MSRHLYIAGEGRISDLEKGSLRIQQDLTYQIDTCSFSVKGKQPAEGEEVIVEDDELGRLFAGIIVKVELGRTFPDKSIKVWNVDCDDYTALLDRRLVVESYENMSASDIFLDIVTKYCSGFTTNGVRSGAPVIESTGAEFEYKRPSECFKWLCDYVGWHWQPDYYKDLKFFSAEDLASPAPLVLVPGGKFRFGKHSIDTQGLRNRVYIRGGTMLSDPQVIQWKADGVARIWALPWGPHEVSLAVGEAPMTVGVENLHDEADYDYMMSFSEKYIRCSAQTSTPVEGTTISLTARQDIVVITMVEDYASQAAIAAVQGGDGIYEHIIDDDSLTTIQAAEAAGMADLKEYANPKVKGYFETEIASSMIEVDDIEYNTGAISLNGVSSCIAFEDGEIIPGPPFTIETWIRPRNPSNNYARLFVQGAGASSINPYIYFRGDQLNVGYNSTNAVAGAPVVDGIWQHFAWTFDGTTHKCYINGADVTTTAVGSGSGYLGATYIGRRQSGNYFSCDLDEFRIWGSARAPQEIAENYNKMVPRDHPNLLAYWRFDDETAIDEKGNHNGIPVDIVKTTEGIQKLSLVIGKKTIASPWAPGQTVTINLPDRGVVGEYLIQRVTITPTWSNPSIWTFRVDYGGRLLGIADFLKALVSAQQKKRAIEPAKNVQKYIYGEETLTVGDELITVTRELPFVCGDSDAICGMVVVSNG